MANLSKQIQNRISKYNPKGELAHTAKMFLALCEINHVSTKEHVQRVALLAEKTAIKLRKDPKATFFAGLLHDIGKIILPHNLFDGHDISQDEYAHVKQHAIAGFKALHKLHMFTAFCAGLHHNLYSAGYGVSINEFPKSWSPATIKKVLEISAIISICDFVDAYTTRKTTLKDPISQPLSLKELLYNKYPNDHLVVDTVLNISKKEIK